MPALRSVLIGLSACFLVGCETTPTPPQQVDLSPRQQELVKALASFTGAYDVSQAAMATAVLNEEGEPVGLLAYEDPSSAVRAGDTAAFIASIKTGTIRNGETSGFPALVVSIDEAAAGDFTGALETLSAAEQDDATDVMAGFLKAWYLALDGQTDKAVEAHRSVTARMPGLSGDLSLAALLDSVERSDEALGVYAAITPGEIVAPQHDFDPQVLVYSHIRLVVARQALLLRRLGRIDEAQDQYRKLAAAEPEQVAQYQSAIEALSTGRGIDDETLSVQAAFSRALSDYSLSLAYQRLIAGALLGDRQRGYDDNKGAFDQLALILDPQNDSLRLAIYDDFYDEAMFDAAAHILSVAPEATVDLKLAEASVHVRQNAYPSAVEDLKKALSLSDPEEKLGTVSSAMGLYALMQNRAEALKLAKQIGDLAETTSEKAAAYGMASSIYDQFGEHEMALKEARAAAEIDNTHDRRMVLANRLADAGQIEEGLTVMRDEALARPNDPYMLNSLGYYLVLHTDRLEEAFRVLARASNLAPNDPYIADSFGWVRYKMGDLDGARRYIELSQQELLPNRHWEIEDHLGDIYWHQGDKDKAKEAWAIALSEYPPEEERKKIQEKAKSGLTGPVPTPLPLPDVSLDTDAEIERQDI